MKQVANQLPITNAPASVSARSASAPPCRRATMPSCLPHSRPAFTLIELLVVIGIIILVVAATIPALSVMQTQSRKEAGYNTVSVAVEAARQLATQNKSKKDPIADGGSSVGTAVLFTNTGSVRLLEHDPDVSFTSSGNENGNAYVDISGRDYISMPNRVGIVGIRRSGNNLSGLELVAPPFALRFSQHGNLTFGNTSTNDGAFNVYYDGDYDGSYDADSTRGSSYNPNASSNQNYNTSEGKYEVPFDEIETVVGVIAFDAGEVPNISASELDDPSDPESAAGRILEIGRPVFFSRYTGAPLRSQ